MSDFFDRTQNEIELLETMDLLGENITFLNVDGEDIHCKLSTYTKMKSNITNLAAKDFNNTGVMTFPNKISTEILKGSYFVKDNDPNKTYLLMTTNESAISDKVVPCGYVECNKRISIGYTNVETVDYMEMKVFYPLYENVECYWQENISFQTKTSIGTFENDKITVVIPSFYPPTIKDYISVKVFDRADKTSKDVQLVDKLYNIQAIDNSLIRTLDNVTYYGVFSIQVKEDI